MRFSALTGRMKMEDGWAGGVRLGYLIAPNVLSYVNGGYSGSQWSGAGLTNLAGPAGVHTTPRSDRNGWFVGGGVENSLNIFGIAAPGWFMKTEYRAAYYDRRMLPSVHRCRQRRDHRHDQLQAVGADRQHVAGLSLQLGWRSDPGQVLISAKSAAQKPRHRPGLFCACKGAVPTSPPCFHGSPRATAAFSDQYARRNRHSISDQSGSVIACSACVAIGHRLGAADARRQQRRIVRPSCRR